MRIPVSKAVDSFVAYMSNEILKVSSLRDRFVMFAALGAMKARPDSILSRYGDTLRTVGILDSEGMLCTDSVRAAMDMAFDNVASLELAGFTFNRNDALELLRMMEA